MGTEWEGFGPLVPRQRADLAKLPVPAFAGTPPRQWDDSRSATRPDLPPRVIGVDLHKTRRLPYDRIEVRARCAMDVVNAPRWCSIRFSPCTHDLAKMYSRSIQNCGRSTGMSQSTVK